MTPKVPMNVKTLVYILDAAFEQIKKQCEVEDGSIADNYVTYNTIVDALESTLRLWRSVDDNYSVDDNDDVLIDIRPL